MDEPIEAMHRAEDANIKFRPITIARGLVTRPAHAASATIHSFLKHLRSNGLDGVPEPLELNGDIETLRFIDGASGGDAWSQQHSNRGIASAARLLRKIHDAASDWTPPSDAVWGAPPIYGHDVVFCHGDPGPWNFVWRDQEAVALIDWDFLHPAPRLDDVAYALAWFTPLREDRLALEWHHFPRVPDRKARIRVLLDAYGTLPAFDVVETVTRRMRQTIDHERALADQHVEPQRTWVADGSLQRQFDEIDWIRTHRDLFA